MAERDSNMPSVPSYAGTVAPYALSADPSAEGATVISVTPDSPAYDIGLEPGMRVLAVNGKPLTDMIVWLWETEDVEAEIEVFDPRDNTVASAVIERFPGEEWGVDFDGVVDPSAEGATVISVTPDSPAYDIGLEPGMRVLAVNGKPLTDMIVWLWEPEDVEAEIEVFDPRDHTVASAVIERFPGEEWGVDFDGVVFDGKSKC